MKMSKGQLPIVKNEFTYKFFAPVFVEAEEAVVIGIHTEL
jgi:hypothetical protein